MGGLLISDDELEVGPWVAMPLEVTSADELLIGRDELTEMVPEVGVEDRE
jgi:hypothetical protein